MPIKKVNTTPSNSHVIEHLNEDERNINFVYKILSYLNMSTNSLTSYKFINSICVIYFNSPNSLYTFHSNVNHIKKDPDSPIFIYKNNAQAMKYSEVELYIMP